MFGTPKIPAGGKPKERLRSPAAAPSHVWSLRSADRPAPLGSVRSSLPPPPAPAACPEGMEFVGKMPSNPSRNHLLYSLPDPWVYKEQPQEQESFASIGQMQTEPAGLGRFLVMRLDAPEDVMGGQLLRPDSVVVSRAGPSCTLTPPQFIAGKAEKPLALWR